MVAVMEPSTRVLTELEVDARIAALWRKVADGTLSRNACRQQAHALRMELYVQQHPYWVFLRLEGVEGEYQWAQCRSLIRAGEIAGAAMREQRPGHLPHRKRCRGYRIVDMRTREEIELSPAMG